MTTWAGPISAITLFAEDVAAAKAFYERVFGLPVVFQDDIGGLQVRDHARQSAAGQRGSGADRACQGGVTDAGSRLQFTITVDDVDATCADLVARGVTLLNGPIDRPWGVRTACFSDPAGQHWEIAH